MSCPYRYLAVAVAVIVVATDDHAVANQAVLCPQLQSLPNQDLVLSISYPPLQTSLRKDIGESTRRWHSKRYRFQNRCEDGPLICWLLEWAFDVHTTPHIAVRRHCKSLQRALRVWSW